MLRKQFSQTAFLKRVSLGKLKFRSDLKFWIIFILIEIWTLNNILFIAGLKINHYSFLSIPPSQALTGMTVPTVHDDDGWMSCILKIRGIYIMWQYRFAKKTFAFKDYLHSLVSQLMSAYIHTMMTWKREWLEYQSIDIANVKRLFHSLKPSVSYEFSPQGW